MGYVGEGSSILDGRQAAVLGGPVEEKVLCDVMPGVCPDLPRKRRVAPFRVISRDTPLGYITERF